MKSDPMHLFLINCHFPFQAGLQRFFLALGLLVSAASYGQIEPAGSAAMPPAKGAVIAKHDGSQQLQAWSQECPVFDRLTKDYQGRYYAPMRNWAQKQSELMRAKKVVYPFSGADIATASALFPSADHLVLIADQWPEFAGLQTEATLQSAKECETMAYFARYGYFRTHDLEGKDSVRPRFLKLLAYGMLLSDARIRSIDFLAVRDNGTLNLFSTSPAGKPDGIRFVVTTGQGREIVIDYVRINLSDPGLKAGPRFHELLSAQIQDATVLIKSASHLLQKPYFSALAAIISKRAHGVVQDETGLDIESMRHSFDVRSFGKFEAPHPLWAESASGVRLAQYMKEQPATEPLPFAIGYEKKGHSVLLLGTRKAQR